MFQLISLRPAEEAKAQNPKQAETVVNTPFQAFMAALQARQTQGSQRSMQSAVWGAVPIERLLADATWALLTAVAGKIGTTLSTRKEVRSLAQRTDRLVGVGLLLVHGTPEAAAEAFDRQVIGAINSAVKCGYRPGQELSRPAWKALGQGQTMLASSELRSQKSKPYGALSSLWTTPGYLFFAECFKAARELHDDLSARLERFTRLNEVGHGLPASTNYTEADHLQDVLAAIRSLDVLEEYEYVLKHGGKGPNLLSNEQQVLAAEQKMTGWELDLATLRAIPMNFEYWPETVKNQDDPLEERWVRSRTLCSAVGEPADCVSSSELYEKAARAAQSMSAEVLIDRMVADVKRRGTVWSEAQEACFRKMAAKQVQEVQNNPVTVVQVESVAQALIDVDLDDLQIDAKAAKEVADDHFPAINELLTKESKAKVRRFLQRQVLSQIDWATINWEDVHGFFVHEVIPTDLLMEKVKLMSKPYQRELVQALIHEVGNWTPQTELVPELVKYGIMPVDRYLFDHHLGAIPKKQLFPFLETELIRLSEEFGLNIGPHVHFGVLCRAIDLLSFEQVQQLAGGISTRRAMIGFASLLCDEHLCHEHGQAKRRKSLMSKCGVENWQLLVLAGLVASREIEYNAPVKIDGDYTPLFWRELATPAHGLYTELKSDLFTKERKISMAEQFIELISEERAFRFLHEGDPKVETLWVDYLAAQKRHFVAYGR
jgi:hypothetical protein